MTRFFVNSNIYMAFPPIIVEIRASSEVRTSVPRPGQKQLERVGLWYPRRPRGSFRTTRAELSNIKKLHLAIVSGAYEPNLRRQSRTQVPLWPRSRML